MNKILIGISFLASLITIFSCTESTILGTEILEGDFVDVDYHDSTTIHFKTIAADSTRVYPIANSLFLLGQTDDPVFGSFDSYAYFELKQIFIIPKHTEMTLDSVVLSMSYSKTNFWGNENALFDVEVYELGESLEGYDTLYSDQDIQKGAFLGSSSFNPFSGDTIRVTTGKDTATYYNTFRVKLDKSFGEKLFNDSLILHNDTLIAQQTNGIWLRAKTSENAVFGLENTVYLDEHSNKLIFYYKDASGNSYKHPLTLGGKRGVHYANNFAGSEAKKFLDGHFDSDSIAFLSGGQGLNIQVDLPDHESFKGKLINYAYLDFYAAEPIDVPGLLPYAKIDRIYSYYKTNGSSKYTQDLSYSLVSGVPAFFNGYLQQVTDTEGETLYKYRLNLTTELKRRIREYDLSPIILTPYLSEARAYRSVIFGPKHSRYPARLKVTFTNN